MSERELRDFVEHDPGCPMRYSNMLIDDSLACKCGLAKALVKVLRWLSDGIRRDPANRTTFRETRHWIEDEFHIRLTEDGWEYTE